MSVHVLSDSGPISLTLGSIDHETRHGRLSDASRSDFVMRDMSWLAVIETGSQQ